MDGDKKWYLSKTLWVNILATAAAAAEKYFGIGVGAEEQMAILAIINLILRLVTKDKLVIKKV